LIFFKNYTGMTSSEELFRQTVESIFQRKPSESLSLETIGCILKPLSRSLDASAVLSILTDTNFTPAETLEIYKVIIRNKQSINVSTEHTMPSSTTTANDDDHDDDDDGQMIVYSNNDKDIDYCKSCYAKLSVQERRKLGLVRVMPSDFIFVRTCDDSTKLHISSYRDMEQFFCNGAGCGKRFRDIWHPNRPYTQMDHRTSGTGISKMANFTSGKPSSNNTPKIPKITFDSSFLVTLMDSYSSGIGNNNSDSDQGKRKKVVIKEIGEEKLERINGCATRMRSSTSGTPATHPTQMVSSSHSGVPLVPLIPKMATFMSSRTSGTGTNPTNHSLGPIVRNKNGGFGLSTSSYQQPKPPPS